MKLTAITVQKSQLEFTLSEAFTGMLALTEYAPVIHGDERVVARETLNFAAGKATAARFDGSHDRAFGRFAVEGADGVCYVTDFAEDVPENVYPYPQPDTIKTLVCSYENGKEFGIKQSRFDVSLPGFV